MRPYRIGPWRARAEEGTAARDRYEFHLDRPTDWQTPLRKVYLAGCCFDRHGREVRAIRALVGRRKFPGNYGLARWDVGKLFPDYPAAARSGFAVAVHVPPGERRLTLQIQGDDGVWRGVFEQSVRGLPSDAAAEVPPEDAAQFEPENFIASRFNHWLDEPKDWNRKVRHVSLAGWCVAASGPDVSEVRARVGRRIFRGQHDVLRPDVALVFPDRPAALRSGFSIEVLVPWGSSRLVLEARSEDGDWEGFFTRRVRGPFVWGRRQPEEEIGNYAEWICLHERLTRADQARLRLQIESFTRQPRFSIILPAYNSNAIWLRRAIASVRQQLYPHWQLCLVDDASTAPHVWSILQRAARRDSRIQILRRQTNGHVSAASNDALAMATGEYIGLLDHDDELAPTALYFAALELNRRPELQVLYSDEDKLDRQGRRCDPYFKPDWNPDLLTAQNYISHFGIYGAALVRKVGGFRTGYEGAQDYDLTLRCTENIAPAQIGHLPHVLYHWRITEESTARLAAAKPYAFDAALRVVQEHFDRRGSAARVVPHEAGGYLRVIHPPPRDALVSIIIPTRDRGALLRSCLASIVERTDYPNYEIIIVDNDSTEADTLAFLDSLRENKRVRVLRVAGEFNFSKLNNLGVAQARGEFVALLNNDLEVMNREWLSEMAGHAARPEVGAVGARLWYPNGDLQHGGVLLGLGGVANHAHRLLQREERGYFSRAQLTQNFCAVTAACMVVRKEVYQRAGGLDQVNLPVAFNDVDFCLRLREAGRLIVWTPYAELIHHESASRGFENTGGKQQRFMSEVEFMEKRWGHLLRADPYYNPNLSLGIEQPFKLAFPPRTERPWAPR